MAGTNAAAPAGSTRACEHTQLLTAAGLFDEPVRPDDLYSPQEDEPWDLDEIVAINWENDL